MERPYHRFHKNDTQALAHFLSKNGQALLPMVELIEQSKAAVDELIDVLGRASVEAVLRISAEGMAGPPQPGKKGGAIGWHGTETGTVTLEERKLRVRRPRLRKKRAGKEGEISVPAYEAMGEDGKLGGRMLEILLRGVSTRQYKHVLPEMAETVGVSKSSVSAEALAASEKELRRLCDRRWDRIEREPTGAALPPSHRRQPPTESRTLSEGFSEGAILDQPGIIFDRISIYGDVRCLPEIDALDLRWAEIALFYLYCLVQRRD